MWTFSQKVRCVRRVLLLLFLACTPLVVYSADSSLTGSKAKAFINGEWFTGKDFRSTTFYAVDGVLTRQKPTGPTETVDLQGGFVVPAFADAHNHFPSSKQDLAAANRAYLDAGVFYVLNAGGNSEPANAIRAQLGTPATVDVIFAHALFTCPGGHPRPYLEYLVDQGVLPFDKEKLEGLFFNSVDSIAQLEKIWPQYLATRPDFVKLVFVFSELYGPGDASQKSLGLRPAIAKEIVRRAKLAGLRSGAHIESAEDFHNSVEADVDLVMHLPAFPDPQDRQAAYRDKSNWEARYTISASDIKFAAQRGVTVVTTAASGSAENFEKPNPLVAMNENEKRFRKITIQNLRHLKDAGVKFAVGSDTMPGAGALAEIEFLKETDVFSNLELLKMWSETTPNAIFPQHKIGALEEGYEANFLVLEGNPIQDFSDVKRIRMRVKQGDRLQ
jgi:imidazolonepropionase-like amidohydrolase